MKFMCKYCNKTYSCGMGLGGHLSSHKMVTDYDIPNAYDGEEDDFGGRGKKVERSEMTLEDSIAVVGCTSKVQGHCHHVCKECGKGFQSLKALCGHMACHSEKERPASSRQRYESRIEDKRGRLSVVADKCSESEGDSGQMQPCRRSKRVRCMTRSKFADGFSFISGMMPVEEVARCLIMMSNDRRSVRGHWGRVGDYSGSLSVELVDKPSSSGGYSGSPKSSDEISFEPTRAYKRLDRLKSYYTKSNKRVTDMALSQEKQGNTRKNNQKHECPICFRVFKSGQAMGGHKRSHFLGGIEEVTGGAGTERVVQPEVHQLIDLNFPAFLEEGEGQGQGQGEGGLLPW